MSLLDSLFGSGMSGVLNATYIQPDHNVTAQRDLQQQQAFNQKMSNWNQNPFAQSQSWVSHNWVFAGKPCSVQEFADAVWPGEHEDKMLFLLTHSGPAK